MALVDRGRQRKSRWITHWLLLAVCGLALAGGGVAIGYKLSDVPNPRERMTLATELQSQGQADDAIAQLKLAIRQSPDNVEARWMLAQSYVALGDGQAASDQLERLPKENFPDPSALDDATLQALFLQRKYGEVVGRVAADPGEGEHAVTRLILQGYSQIGLGLDKSAHKTFSRVLELSPDNTEAKRGLALVAFENENLVESELHLSESLDTAPDDLRAWLLKGELGLKQSEYALAAAAFEKAVEISPDHAAARLGLARALLGLGKPGAAQAQIKVVGAVHPRNPYVNYLHAVAWRQKDNLAAAKTSLKEVFKEVPDHPASLLLMGSIHYLQHDFNRAKQTLTRFLRTSPGHGAATKLLGAAYLRLNDASSAAVVLERGIQAAPNDPQLLAMLGSAYIRNQRFEAGLGYLEKAAKLAPDAAAIRTQLALGLLASGDDERGVAELSAAGETQGFFWDDFLLSVTYLHQRDYDNALASAEKLAANEPAKS